MNYTFSLSWHFHCPNVIISSHLDPPQMFWNYWSGRKICLQVLEVLTESHGSFLLPVFMEKISQRYSPVSWPWIEIQSCKIGGQVEEFKPLPQKIFMVQKTKKNAKAPKWPLPSTSALFSGNELASTPSCIFCNNIPRQVVTSWQTGQQRDNAWKKFFSVFSDWWQCLTDNIYFH